MDGDAGFITALNDLWGTAGGKLLVLTGIAYLLLKQWGGQGLDFLRARLEARDQNMVKSGEASHSQFESLRKEARDAAQALVTALNERIDTLEAALQASDGELAKAVEHAGRCDAELANLRADHRSLLERQSGLAAAFDIMRRAAIEKERAP